MAPLPCASVSDLYGSNFGLSAEEIAQQTLKNNQQCAENNVSYQKNLKENEIAGKVNETSNKPLVESNSGFARRPAWSDINNNWPSNQDNSMFNRFQNIFGTKENFGVPKTDSECLQQLVHVAHDIQLMLKIIMFVIILLFIIKILEKKN